MVPMIFSGSVVARELAELGHRVARRDITEQLGWLDIVGLDWRGGVALGAIRDRHRHTLTAVVPASGPQFVVEPRGEQERLLTGWGDLLGQYAFERGVVSHLSWSDLAQPSGMADHIAWAAARLK